MPDVDWSNQVLADLSDLLHGIHSCKEDLLLEVIVHAEEECLFFLPLGMLDRIELLIQYQSIISRIGTVLVHEKVVERVHGFS